MTEFGRAADWVVCLLVPGLLFSIAIPSDYDRRTMNVSVGGDISGALVKAEVGHVEPEMKGWLLKWTNYLKGYQRRWFVLSNGVLSYFRYLIDSHIQIKKSQLHNISNHS